MAALIVALDVDSRDAAVRRVKEIGEAVDFYKIGLELFTAEGPDVVRAIRDLGKRVFLDLKFHDIPRTVERAVRSAGRLGVDLLTIHSTGARAMIRAAADAAAEFGETRPRILAVTVLTSLDQTDLADVGIAGRTPADQVLAMAQFATANGAHGLVCSPKEVGTLSRLLPAGTLFITPGVRPAGAPWATRSAWPRPQTRCATAPPTSLWAARSSARKTPPPPRAPSARKWTPRSDVKGAPVATERDGRTRVTR